MKLFQAIFLLPLVNAACPLASSSSLSPPDDEIHSSTLRRRRVASLSNHQDAKSQLDSIIENRNKNRELQSSCFTTSDYDNIDTDVAAIAAAFTSNETLGYFWEGLSGKYHYYCRTLLLECTVSTHLLCVVLFFCYRLAAHDFLDYNKDNETDAYGHDGMLSYSFLQSLC